MKTGRMIAGWAVLVVLALVTTPATTARAADGIDQQAVNRAHEFLRTVPRGRDILSYLHFGAKYQRHTYKESRFVNDAFGKPIPGQFALVYRFDWEDDGVTEVAFLCDPRGNVYRTHIISSNGVLSQPFVLANATIKALGNLLLESFKDQITAEQRRQVQQIVDAADAKAMLEWSLKLQQGLGR